MVSESKEIVSNNQTRKVTIKAFRFNAETDYLPYISSIKWK